MGAGREVVVSCSAEDWGVGVEKGSGCMVPTDASRNSSGTIVVSGR